MQHEIGICVVGCGGVSGGHVASYGRNPVTKVVATVDIREEVACAAAARAGGADYYTDYREAIQRSDVDVVDICLPHHLHAPVAIAAAQAGKHVFVEKPISNTLEEADAMIKAACDAGVKLIVEHTKRYENRHRRVKALLDQGLIGTPILVRYAYPQDITPMWATLDEAGRKMYWKRDGVLPGIGIHALDTLRYLIGEATEVSAMVSRSKLLTPDRPGEDSVIVLLRFANGALAEMMTSYVVRDPRAGSTWNWMPLEIWGERGYIEMDGFDKIKICSDDQSAWQNGPGEVLLSTKAKMPGPPPDGLAAAVAHMVDCIINDKEPETSGLDARKSLELVIAAYKSAETGGVVRLPL